MQNSRVNSAERPIHRDRGDSVRKPAALLAMGLSLLIASKLANAAEAVKVPMTADRWTKAAGTVNFIEYMGKPSIELKAGNYAQPMTSMQSALLRPTRSTIFSSLSATRGSRQRSPAPRPASMSATSRNSAAASCVSSPLNSPVAAASTDWW
jgi:hypothetical protein